MGLEDLILFQSGAIPQATVLEVAEVTWRERTGVYYIIGKIDNKSILATDNITFKDDKRVTIGVDQYFVLEQVTGYRTIEKF